MASDVWSARHRVTFRELKRCGTVVRVSPLSAVVVRHETLDPLRLAFAIPTGVGSAVTRNRLRRRVRARLGQHAPSLRGRVMLVRVQPNSARLDAVALGECTDRLAEAARAVPARRIAIAMPEQENG